MKRTPLIAVGALILVAAAGFYAMRAYRAGESGGMSVTASIQQTPETPGGEAAAAPAPASPAPAEGGRRAPPVEVAQARAADSTTVLESVGTLASDESVSIAAEVAGRIASISFGEGEAVKSGDVLVKLDDALARAELTNVEAELRLAQSNYDRAISLSRSGAGTERARDEALAALETGRAAVDLARVRLDKTEIRAPFDGVIGLRAVSVGAYAQIGQTLVNLEKIDSLKLDFRLPEINLRDVQTGQFVEVRVDALPDRTFEGRVYAIDPMVDVNGRALKIRARLANPDNVLRPGLFARVRLRGAPRGEVVLIPEGAVIPRGTDTFVFTIQDGRAVEAKVRLGRRSNGEVEVLEGVPVGATVIVAGHQRARDGGAVEIITSQRAS